MIELDLDEANRAARVLTDRFPDLTHSEAVEIVARQLGYRDWATGATQRPAFAQIGASVPVLRSFDKARAHEFYVEYLRFSIEWEHRFEEGSPLYMRLRRDRFVLDLSEHHGDGTPGSTVWVPVSNVAALHKELQATGYPRMNPGIEYDAPGGPTLQVIDPFSNTIRFCQNIE